MEESQEGEAPRPGARDRPIQRRDVLHPGPASGSNTRGSNIPSLRQANPSSLRRKLPLLLVPPSLGLRHHFTCPTEGYINSRTFYIVPTGNSELLELSCPSYGLTLGPPVCQAVSRRHACRIRRF